MTSWQSYVNLYQAHGMKRVWTHFREVEWFDYQHGTDTATWLPLSGYTGNIADSKHYQASFTSEVVNIFKKIASDYDVSNYRFYDIGAGKGKILILANQYLKCRAYYGIECNETLADVAEKNLKKTAAKGTMIRSRAEAFTDYAEQCILYLCDPFGEETLRAIMTNVTQKARSVILIYNNPVYSVEAFGFLRVAETNGWHANYQTAIFTYSAK